MSEKVLEPQVEPWQQSLTREIRDLLADQMPKTMNRKGSSAPPVIRNGKQIWVKRSGSSAPPPVSSTPPKPVLDKDVDDDLLTQLAPIPAELRSVSRISSFPPNVAPPVLDPVAMTTIPQAFEPAQVRPVQVPVAPAEVEVAPDLAKTDAMHSFSEGRKSPLPRVMAPERRASSNPPPPPRVTPRARAEASGTSAPKASTSDTQRTALNSLLRASQETAQAATHPATPAASATKKLGVGRVLIGALLVLGTATASFFAVGGHKRKGALPPHAPMAMIQVNELPPLPLTPVAEPAAQPKAAAENVPVAPMPPSTAASAKQAAPVAPTAVLNPSANGSAGSAIVEIPKPRAASPRATEAPAEAKAEPKEVKTAPVAATSEKMEKPSSREANDVEKARETLEKLRKLEAL